MSEGKNAKPFAETETCLHCGETRAWAKVPGRICGIESGYEYRKLEHEWPRHRWANWTDKELDYMGVKPEAFEKHRRTDALTFQWIACDDTVRGHHPATADCVPDFASEIGQCIACGHKSEPTDSGPVHWVGEAPTSLHGNGAASFDRTTRDPAGVTCALCQTLLARGEGRDDG